MGWDANASVVINWDKAQLKDKDQRIAFKEARDFVIAKASVADGHLDLGGLDCSLCAKMLEKATGENCWIADWSAEEVQKIQEKSNWDFEYNKGDAWAYWSARKFLETCARLRVGISFSY